MNAEYEEDANEELEFIGYCRWCKDPIAHVDKYVKLRKKYYHEDCLEQARDSRKELKFE